VIRQSVPNVKIGPDGQPTPESLQALYNYLSKNYGKDYPVLPSYYSDADYRKVVDYAERTMNDPNRRPYEWFSLDPNTCVDFAARAVSAGRQSLFDRIMNMLPF
jgi:hypothetical protein